MASWIHTPRSSAVRELYYHQEPAAREVMWTFSVSVHCGVRGATAEGGGRDSPQGSSCVCPRTLKACCPQSVSRCHQGLVRCCSCAGVPASEAQRAAQWLELERYAAQADGSGRGSVCVDPRGLVLS